MLKSTQAPAVTQPTNADVRAIADLAGADPRSVVRRLAGLPVKGAARVAIDHAIVAHFAARRAA